MIRVVKIVFLSTTTVPPPVNLLMTARPLLWASFALISSGTFLHDEASYTVNCTKCSNTSA